MDTVTDGITVLLTIHGIGFQQFPDDAAGKPGYADGLHERLSAALGGALSDDPNRKHAQPGQNGVIYVKSAAEDQGGVVTREQGLSRLGRRIDPAKPDLDISGAPLVEEGKSISHVALVYTPSEQSAWDPGSMLETLARGIVSVKNYASLSSAKALIDDIRAAAPPRGAAQTAPAPSSGSLVPRDDLAHREGVLHGLLHKVHHNGEAAPPPSGPLDVLRSVEDDVAAYAVRNELREAVRDFVREALQRLFDRGDVKRIIVNAHSQGCVVSFDVLRTMPQEVVAKVSHFFTLGCPLRKYAETLDWGKDVARLGPTAPPWTNVVDRRDPVADPLTPPQWKLGDPITPGTADSIFSYLDPASGKSTPRLVTDVLVDNVSNVAAGSLRAHDYWGNTAEVLPILTGALTRQPAAALAATP